MASLTRRTILRTPSPCHVRASHHHHHHHHHHHQSPKHRKESFASRARTAWRGTKVVWRPIPITLGIAFLAVCHFYRVRERTLRQEQPDGRRSGRSDDAVAGERQREEGEGSLRPKRRERIRPSGPWSVQIMSTIPLKALSRWWGWFNSLTIPEPLRIPGFTLYGYLFGVNFDEASESDLRAYRNLSEFFYRALKPGLRPVDPRPNTLVSPADGTVVQFGFIEHGEVEQVKGVTYHLDALLGQQAAGSGNGSAPSNLAHAPPAAPHPSAECRKQGDEDAIRADEEFARVNGISYTLPNLLSGRPHPSPAPSSINEHRHGRPSSSQPPIASTDQSTASANASETVVAADLSLGPAAQKPWDHPASTREDRGNIPTALYYCVVYLAPGDYHRFHSPVSWVVESRRHFAGELYSVSPFLVKNLPGLFTLNERVVLLGRWKYGFFSYTPVGATNVGSIVINFDRELRTNSLLTDTLADRAAELAQERGEPYPGYAEATYAASSPVLGGHPLKKGDEMGGFQLGSTIVMVFEAPKGRRPTFDEGWGVGAGVQAAARKGGWKWCIEKGQKLKVGEKIGWVVEEEEEDDA